MKLRPLLILVLLGLMSCEEEIDTANPIIEVSVKKNNQAVNLDENVRGIVQVIITSNETASYSVYVGDSLLGEAMNVNLAQIDVDTRLVADGAHSLKVIAVDASGNASETQVSIKTQNRMLVVNTFYSLVVFVISDNEGSVIASGKPDENNKVTIDYPLDYTSGNINVTYFYVSENGNSTYSAYTGYSVMDVAPGEYSLPNDQTPAPGSGLYTVTITPSMQGKIFPIVFDSKLVSYVPDVSQTYGLFNASTDAYFFTYYGGIVQKYTLIRNIVGGSSLTVDDDFYNNEMNPLTVKSLPFASGTYLSSVYGFRNNKWYICSSGYGQDVVNAYYPVELYNNFFTDFITTINRTTVEDGRTVIISQPAVNGADGQLSHVNEYDASVGNLNRNYPTISFTKTGTADNVKFQMNQINSTTSNVLYWVVTAPVTSGQNEIKLPTFPSEIRTLLNFPQNLEMRVMNLNLTDFTTQTSYQSMVPLEFSGSYSSYDRLTSRYKSYYYQ